MDFLIYTESGEYKGGGRLNQIPRIGDYFWVSGWDYKVVKVVYNWKGDADKVKLVVRV